MKQLLKHNMRFIYSHILILFVLILSSFVMKGQDTIVVDSPEYKDLKSNNLLDGSQVITNDATPINPKPGLNGPSSLLEKGSNSCFGYFPPNAGATSVLAGVDDGSTGIINLPFTFCFYGTNYTSLYINSNGNVTFNSSSSSFSSTGFPTSSGNPMIAPFWADIDFGSIGACYYEVLSNAIIIHWVSSGYYDAHSDKTDTFMLILTDGTSPLLSPGNNVGFFYEDMQWTTGDASNGTNGFGGIAATAGVDKGNGSSFIQIGRFDKAGTTYDGPYGSNDGVDWLDNQVFMFNVCSSTNIKPLVTDFNYCDTIRVCLDDTLDFNFSVLSGESGQTTTIYWDTVTDHVQGFNVLTNTPGNTAQFESYLVSNAANAGDTLNIYFQATDIPGDTTSFSIIVIVYNQTVSIDIQGNSQFCEGESTTLTEVGGFLSYYWSTGETTNAITVTSGGTYNLEVYNGFCYYDEDYQVTELLSTPIVFSYDPVFCPYDDAYYLSINDNYLSYSWNTGSNVDSTLVPSTGNYVVEALYSNGCTVTDSITITQAPNNYISPDTSYICSSNSFVSVTNANSQGGVWSYTGPGNITFTSPTSSASVITFSAYGEYLLTYIDNQCSDTAITTINYLADPTAEVVGNLELCTGDTTALTYSGNYVQSVSWYNVTTGALISSDDMIELSEDGDYQLNFTNTCSSDSVEFTINVDPCITPNVITPNNDGKNDVFFVHQAESNDDVHLIIYNRWGRVVYKTDAYDNTWGGEKNNNKPLHDGVYYYVMTWNGGVEEQAGTITVFVD